MNVTPGRRRHLPGIILALALILRILTALAVHPPLFSDAVDYAALGRSLAAGEGYAHHGQPTAYRTPGYPAMLAAFYRLFGETALPVRLFQALADACSCALVYLIGKRLFSRETGVMAAGIYAVLPGAILYVPMLMTETVFTTVFLLTVFISLDPRNLRRLRLAEGFLVGLGTLIRPLLLPLPAVMALVRIVRKEPLRDALQGLCVTAAGALIVIAPWLTRNYIDFGRLTVTTSTGVNFWIGTHEGATGTYSYPAGNPLEKEADECARSDLGMRLGGQFILSHPAEYLLIEAKKWAHFFSTDYWLLLALNYQPGLPPPSASALADLPVAEVLLMHVPFATVLLLAAFAACCSMNDRRWAVMALLSPVAYWIVVHLMFYAGGRYRVPVVPLVAIAAAYGAVMLRDRTAVMSRGRMAAFLLFGCLFAGGWTAERLSLQRQASRELPVPAVSFPVPVLPPIPDSVAGAATPSVPLDGTWDFDDGSGAPPAPIEVPGEWEMQGFSVKAGATAHYRRTFTIPAGWEHLRRWIRFDAVSSWCSVSVNGVTAGTHEGSFVPFAFDITPAVSQGINRLDVSVRWGTIADTLACTSQYAAHPVGGILRNVRIFALPETHVQDFTYETRFDAALTSASITLHTVISSAGSRRVPADIAWALLDERGSVAAHGSVPVGPSDSAGRSQVECRLHVDSPRAWDPEHPHLYSLKGTLTVAGIACEILRSRIGLRQIELQGNRFLVNGRPIKLHGVDHHDAHPLRGRSLTPELCRRDVELFREANCNYLRTSHYPPSEAFLEACDELGMFVESEASLCWIAHEAAPAWHGRDYRDPGILPFMVRANIENVLAGRGHPSVIIWSLGNESRWSPLWERVNAEVKRLDPTRPTSFHDQAWGSYNNEGSRADVANYHYPGFDGPATCDRTTDRPTLFGEYMHVQTYARRENEADPGVRGDPWARTLAQMVDSVYAHDGCMGGAIWSGVDDIFHLSKEKICGYGTWGLIDGWRRPKPEYAGARKAYAPIVLRGLPAALPASGQIELAVENRYNATNLSECAILARAGNRVVELHGDVPPHGRGTLTFDPAALGGKTPIVISIRDPRGFICAEESFPPAPPAGPPAAGPAGVSFSETPEAYIVRSGTAQFVVDRHTGSIQCMLAGKDTVARDGGSFMLVHHNPDDGGAPGTSGNNYTQDLVPLSYAPGAATATTVTASKEPGGVVRVAVRASYGTEAEGALTLTFLPTGGVEFSYDYTALSGFTKAAGTLLRQYGLLFTLPRSFDRLSWTRKGLWSVYPPYDPGRLQGNARANPRSGRFIEIPRVAPQGDWKESANALGSNDFRGTKDGILVASLGDGGRHALTVTSDGSQSARSWVEAETVRFFVAGLNGPGSCPFFTGPRPEFPAGSHLRGKFTLYIK